MGKKSRRKRDRRAYKLDPESATLLEKQMKRFQEKFGRPPGPGAPIFFDPEHPTPRPLQAEPVEAEIVQTMKRAGMPPQFIYAFEKTGRLVGETNLHQLSHEEIAEWKAAVAEYFERHPPAAHNNEVDPQG